MMKRLGDYIRPVDVRNRDLKVTRLMGINIEKRFMPSVANVVGTDLSNYKVVLKGQFACNLMHVGRDEKIPVALQKDDEPIIVSPAYVVFEVVDTNVLLTEYLMMWFSRSEFDRNAWFYTDGDVRGGMDRDALFDMQIPVPAIEKQRETVAEYNTLQNRIETNKKLIATLEQTAQTLYRHTFIDNIDPNNLPDGWRMGTLGELIESASKQHAFNKEKLIFLNTSDIYAGEILHHDYSLVSGMPGQAKKRIQQNDILFSEIRPANKRYAFVKEDGSDFVVSTKLMVLRAIQKEVSILRVYHYLIDPSLLDELQREADGKSGTFPQITFDENLKNRPFLIADGKTESYWNEFLSAYYGRVWGKIKENQTLTQMQTLLLSKMGA